MQKGASAMDAALQCGFTDYSSFYRAYVKYAGTSPRSDMTV
jgi:AraC-like DNA-binding protein